MLAKSYVALPQNSAHTVSRTTEQMQAYTGKMKVLFYCSYFGIFGGIAKPAQFESSSFLHWRNVKSLQTKDQPYYGSKIVINYDVSMTCQHSIALNEKVYCNQRGYRVRMSTQGRTFNCMLSGIVRVYRCTSTDDELVVGCVALAVLLCLGGRSPGGIR